MGGGYSTQPFYHMAPRQTMPYSTSDFGLSESSLKMLSSGSGGHLARLSACGDGAFRKIYREATKVEEGRGGVWRLETATTSEEACSSSGFLNLASQQGRDLCPQRSVECIVVADFFCSRRLLQTSNDVRLLIVFLVVRR